MALARYAIWGKWQIDERHSYVPVRKDKWTSPAYWGRRRPEAIDIISFLVLMSDHMHFHRDIESYTVEDHGEEIRFIITRSKENIAFRLREMLKERGVTTGNDTREEPIPLPTFGIRQDCTGTPIHGRSDSLSPT